MKRSTSGRSKKPEGGNQRQLRSGELVRHALVEILLTQPVRDEALEGVSVTVSQARMSPDLKSATVFVEPLGGGDGQAVVDALNRHAKFLRGELGRHIDLRFTPELRFRQDNTFEAASRMDALFNDPRVRADLGLSSPHRGEEDPQGVEGPPVKRADDDGPS